MGTTLYIAEGSFNASTGSPGVQTKQVIVAQACLCQNWRWCDRGSRHKVSYCFSGL